MAPRLYAKPPHPTRTLASPQPPIVSLNPAISRPHAQAHEHQHQIHTTAHLHGNAPKTDPLKFLPPSSQTPPPFPYPPLATYKQRLLGLYGPVHLQFGNTVAPKHNTKARRLWRPNIKVKHLHSRALGAKLRLRVATRVLRTIDKVGGVDEYVLGKGAGRMRELAGGVGWKLRWAVASRTKVGDVERGQRADAVRAMRGKGSDEFQEQATRNVRAAMIKKYGFKRGFSRRGEPRAVRSEEEVDEDEWVDVDEVEDLQTVQPVRRGRGLRSGHMVEESGELPMEERGIVARTSDRVLRTLRLR